MLQKNLVKNIKYFLINNYLNILFVSVLFNGAKSFILPSSYIRGVLVNYGVLSFYLNSLLLFGISLFLIKKKFFSKNIVKACVLFFALLLLNFLFSFNQIFTLIYIVKLLPILFVLLVLINLKNQKININLIYLINFLYIFIFIAQFILQKSAFTYLPFGFYYFNTGTVGLDYFSFFGEKRVIPLGNFPHPNVFAGYLSFINIIYLKQKSYYMFFINLLVIFGLFSFTALVFNFLLLLKQKFSGFTKLFLVLFIILLFFLSYLFGFKIVSLNDRFDQLIITLTLIKDFYIFGVGFNSFVPSINLVENINFTIYKLQPVHNIFLLILVEGGLVVVAFFVYLFKFIKKYFYYSPYLLFILAFGFFDHFLLTLNQGLIIATLTIYLHISIINNNA